MPCNCSTLCSCAPTDLGCFDPCGTLATGIDATTSGVYTLKVGYFGSTVVIESEQTAWEEITFPLSGLNENFTFMGDIIDPDGEHVATVKFTTSYTFTA